MIDYGIKVNKEEREVQPRYQNISRKENKFLLSFCLVCLNLAVLVLKMSALTFRSPVGEFTLTWQAYAFCRWRYVP